MVRCPKCGNIVSSTTKFCQECGSDMSLKRNDSPSKKPDKKKVLLFTTVFMIISLIFLAIMINMTLNTDYTPTDDYNQSTTEKHYVEMKILYTSDWSGAISYGSNIESHDGYGDSRFWGNFTEGQYMGLNIQKQEANHDELQVEIWVDGILVKQADTTAEYGIAMTGLII